MLKPDYQDQNEQLILPTLETNLSRNKGAMVQPQKMRIFTNDEIANSLALLPKAARFSNIDAFQAFLIENLPYNSYETRIRRAQTILARFYPDRTLQSPVTAFSARASEDGVKAAVFYHSCKAEPIAAKVAEELIFPNLSLGRVSREQILEHALHYCPKASLRSQQAIAHSILEMYRLLDAGTIANDMLRFHLHSGSLDGLVYVLTSEFPEPGIYTFDMLFESAVHRWLLWDKEWLREQLYRLHDRGILAKVSEIDSFRQFTLAINQVEALEVFFSSKESNGVGA